MKKIIAFLGLFLMTFVLAPSIALAGPSVDQQYTGGTGSVSIDSSLGRFAQSFKPTYTGLSKVEIELANVSGSKSISVAIRHKVGTVWDEGSVATVNNQVVTNGWNTFDFEDITVLTGVNDYYGIWTTCLENGPQWKYNSGPSTYDKGFAIWQSNDKVDWDFNFKTWGTDPVEILDENTQATDPPDAIVPDGQTVGTGTAPSAATSTAIKVATGLKAEYANSAVNLSWTASTTADIDGYKVFRSETATTGFAEIGKTVKATLAYADSKELMAEKTYYYMVRAYKGTAESASTSTVTIEIPATATVTTTKAKALPFFTDITETTDWSLVQLYWILGGIIGILIALLVVHERERARTVKLLSGKHFRLDK